MAHIADEETPLLHIQHRRRRSTPLPWSQFGVILFLQLAEPLTSQLISPLAPQLIRDIGVTQGDETKVGFCVGLLHSLFFAAQALTVLHWSQISDRVGRKPVLLTGLFGLSLSMYSFGLSKTFVGLVLSRALSGALNGNIGVTKSMMAEITDETNLAQAYAYTPIAWSSGSTLGPLIGGFLFRPADRFPNVFGHVKFFREYPYSLACAIPATFTAIAWIVTFLFLKETLPNTISLRQLIESKFYQRKFDQVALESPMSSTTLATSEDAESRPLPLRALLIPRVLIAAGNYAALSTIDITFRAVQPLFYATPIELGGLGLDPPLIGNILAVYGILSGLFQILFFASLHDQFGSKVVYTVSVSCGIPLVLTFPVINFLARVYGLNWAVWCVIGMQIACAVLLNIGFSCIFIYIAAASPNRGCLGATNGLAQVLVSIMRSIGPASAASMFSLSIKAAAHAWFVYCYLLVVVVIGIGASLLLPRKLWEN
ncbi:MFS multidrug-resistance DHA1 sub-family [Pisolithus thermaeus]|nr:MFS multidrug-resistance DHA1 sub-family [Pisolithus croceorrhizus]KAI6167958.1 MFS multidrug-resistance DHA1 sub-family [Pisolithus thermaeus]